MYCTGAGAAVLHGVPCFLHLVVDMWWVRDWLCLSWHPNKDVIDAEDKLPVQGLRVDGLIGGSDIGNRKTDGGKRQMAGQDRLNHR